MKKAALALCFLAVCSLRPATAQVGGFSDVPKSHWAADSVAHLAAAGILRQAPTPPGNRSAHTARSKASAFDGIRPVTRYEMAVTLYRFVQYIEHANAQGKSKFGAQTQPIDGPTALRRLIAEGYLPASTPLAKEGGKTVSANQFADALAQVIAHSREKTTPLSPDLKSQPSNKS